MYERFEGKKILMRENIAKMRRNNEIIALPLINALENVADDFLEIFFLTPY